jgi:hypothetical protein
VGRKPRDFTREYERRIERGLRRGLTLQEARGRHPKEKPAERHRPGPVAKKIEAKLGKAAPIKHYRSGKAVKGLRQIVIPPDWSERRRMREAPAIAARIAKTYGSRLFGLRFAVNGAPGYSKRQTTLTGIDVVVTRADVQALLEERFETDAEVGSKTVSIVIIVDE